MPFNIKSKPCEVNGQHFESISAACRHFGTSYSRARRRLALGYPIEEAVSIKKDLRLLPARDHLGQNFPSMAAMARHWGIMPRTLNERLDNGWDVKKALLHPVHTEFSPRRKAA